MDRETIAAYFKMAILWSVTGIEWLVKALPTVALLLTVTYTAAQLYVLWRDKLRVQKAGPVAQGPEKPKEKE